MIADRCVSKCRVRTAHAALPSLAKAALTSRHCFIEQLLGKGPTACAVRTLRQFTHQDVALAQGHPVGHPVIPAKAGIHGAFAFERNV